MSGNVWEWCADWYESEAYERYRRGDLSVPAKGTSRVLRGGSWDSYDTAHFRCAFRSDYFHPGNRRGFRAARTLTP
jgi:sulfatase modifying factor 1